MKALLRFAMVALLLVAVALVSALTAMRFAIHGQVVEVPAVVGLTPLDAERVVSGLGLHIEVERQYYSPQIPEGRIMTQMPLPGLKVRRGGGAPVAPRPSTRASSGPQIAKAVEPPQPTPASMIVTQWPPAGQKILAGAVLNFEVK